MTKMKSDIMKEQYTICTPKQLPLPKAGLNSLLTFGVTGLIFSSALILRCTITTKNILLGIP